MQDVTGKWGDTMSCKSKCVIDYNDTTGGMDKVDQHSAAYFTQRKKKLQKDFPPFIGFGFVELLHFELYIRRLIIT